MPRSNNHVDKHAGDIIEKTSFNGNHVRDIKMNTIVVILAAVVLGAAVDVQNPKTVESGNVEDGAEDDKATVKVLGKNESTLLYIQSLIAQLNRISIKKNEEDEDSERFNVDLKKDSDESDIEKNITNESEHLMGRNGEDNRRNILEGIKNILKGEINRRLDIEDNGDISPDADIDDPMINEFSRDEFSGSKVNRGYTGYGANLEMKGRSGGVHEDKPIYYPAIPRRLFYNPGYSGYYPRATPAPVAIPINRDSVLQLPPINIIKSLPHRRTESQVNEETIDILDDANSYKYTPEENEVEAPMQPWGHGNFQII